MGSPFPCALTISASPHHGIPEKACLRCVVDHPALYGRGASSGAFGGQAHREGEQDDVGESVEGASDTGLLEEGPHG